MRVSPNSHLTHQWKCNAKILGAERFDLLFLGRLLFSKIVTRETDHRKAAFLVTLVQLLYPLVLAGVTALTGYVHHQDDVATPHTQITLITVDVRQRNLQQGRVNCTRDRSYRSSKKKYGEEQVTNFHGGNENTSRFIRPPYTMSRRHPPKTS